MEWASSRSAITPDDPVPPNLLESNNPELLCKWLCRYVMETRRTDGSEYPPATLRSLLSGVNRVLQENKAPFSILDKGDVRFKDLQVYYTHWTQCAVSFTEKELEQQRTVQR